MVVIFYNRAALRPAKHGGPKNTGPGGSRTQVPCHGQEQRPRQQALPPPLLLPLLPMPLLPAATAAASTAADAVAAASSTAASIAAAAIAAAARPKFFFKARPAFESGPGHAVVIVIVVVVNHQFVVVVVIKLIYATTQTST